MLQGKRGQDVCSFTGWGLTLGGEGDSGKGAFYQVTASTQCSIIGSKQEPSIALLHAGAKKSRAGRTGCDSWIATRGGTRERIQPCISEKQETHSLLEGKDKWERFPCRTSSHHPWGKGLRTEQQAKGPKRVIS